MTLTDFATLVRRALAALAETDTNDPVERFGDKAFISAVYRRALSFGYEGDGGLAAFKVRLIEAHKARLIVASRADLVGAMPRAAVEASEYCDGMSTWHFVRLPCREGQHRMADGICVFCATRVTAGPASLALTARGGH